MFANTTKGGDGVTAIYTNPETGDKETKKFKTNHIDSSKDLTSQQDMMKWMQEMMTIGGNIDEATALYNKYSGK